MCDPGAIRWAEQIFGDCIVTPRDKVSFAVGLVSNVICLTASLPQVIQNCRRKHVEGQSVFFFALLFTGSCLSLVGIIVTKGLVTQILQSVVYAILDGILLAQFIAYKYIVGTNDSESQETPESVEKEIPPPPMPIILAGMASQVAAADVSAPFTGDQLLGTVFGWVGAVIFIAARFPQLAKNFRMKEVHDLSILYISMMTVGNLTYTVSVLLRSVDPSYLWKQAPFVIGVAGPMICDVVLLFQKWFYSQPESSSIREEEEKEDGQNLPEL
jgi:uncharacterized protein with PQ loop repeat